ncbi:MAG: type II CAAX endopeptidase family protein [Anaerolineae bacterium]
MTAISKTNTTQSESFVRRHAVAIYFILAYVVTWTLIVIIVQPQQLLRGSVGTPQFLLIWVAMLIGSGGMGVLLTALLTGRAGLRELFGGMKRWHVGWRWYAPLLIVPLVAGAVSAVLAQTAPGYVPTIIAAGDKTLPMVMFLVVAFGTFVEELGWTGFANRRLRGHYSTLTIGLVIGVLWACWHFMGDFVGSRANYAELFPFHFLVFWLVPLVAFRVLIVWVYDHTESLLMAQLMHASYSPVLFVLSPSAVTGRESVVYEASFAVLLCLVVAVIMLFDRRRAAAVQPVLETGQR